jgi:two-component system, LytTR family, sensor histidine kinase AgrC
MHNSLLLPLGELLNIVPYAYLCYFPFRGKLRISRNKLLVILSLLTIIQFTIYYFNSSMPFINVKLSFFAWLLVYLFVYFATVRASFSRLFYVFLIIANYACAVIGISNSLNLHFFAHVQSVNGYSMQLICIYAISFVITLPFAFMLYKRIDLQLKNVDDAVWNILWIIPFSFVITLIIFEGADTDQLMGSWRYIVVTLAMALGASAVYYVVTRILFETDENAKLRENVRVINLQLDFQRDEYKTLSEHIAEAKAARHDLRHHLSIIEEYLQSNDTENLLNYLNEYKSSLPDDTELTLCENYASNVIVIHYTRIAKSEGVLVYTNMQLPQDIGIADSDLCIIFGNCLENALEACRRMRHGQKYIHIKSKFRANMLGISIDNSFDGIIEEKGSTILSRKRKNEEGIGLTSVRAVAARYSGTALFEFDKSEFRASIVLNTQK